MRSTATARWVGRRAHYSYADAGTYASRAFPRGTGAANYAARAFTVGIGGPVGSGKTALVSALSGRCVRSDTACTGEVTLFLDRQCAHHLFPTIDHRRLSPELILFMRSFTTRR